MWETIDWDTFWDDDDYALENYVSAPVTDEMIQEAESELGYRLPASYIALMRQHNGGMPRKTFVQRADGQFPAMIEGIYGIGREKPYSLLGELCTAFWVEEWEYPPIGVVICDTPSAGHDMVFLDYTACGPQGEPRVVLVDQEADYRVTELAKDFGEFISRLRTEDELGLNG